jgi:peptidoglycan-associated lipoprotein
MRYKVLCLLAALSLVAACESTSPETGAAIGDGGAAADRSVEAGGGLGFPEGSGVRMLASNVPDRVFFDFDKYDLKPEARRTLQKQAEWLKQNPGIRVTIEGHCDERGTREYNLALGERRANTIRNYLVALGVSSDNISTISYGKERSTGGGSNEATWARDRRGTTVVK